MKSLSTFKSDLELGFARNRSKISLIAGFAFGALSIAGFIKQTLELDEILEEHQCMLDDIEYAEKAGTNMGKEYTHKDAVRDTANLYLKTLGKTIKNYKEPIIFATVSSVSFLACYFDQKSSIVVNSAALGATLKKLRDYEERDIRKNGKREHDEKLYGLKPAETEETEEAESSEDNEADGEPMIFDGQDIRKLIGPGTIVWTDGDPNFDPDDMVGNRIFINHVGEMLNSELKHGKKHYLFMADLAKNYKHPSDFFNDYYKLGITRNPHTGKSYSPSGEGELIQRVTDFRWNDIAGDVHRGFIIDFNIEGDITTYMPARKRSK